MRTIQHALSILTTAALPRLSRDELKALTGAEEHAQCILGQARTVFEGIGGLIASDEDVGCFTDRNDVAALAFLAANVCDMANGLLSLSNQVQYVLDVKAEVKK